MNEVRDIERFSDTIRESQTHLDIQQWQSFVLDLSVEFDRRREIWAHIKDSIPNHKTTNGLYAFFAGNDCLYIGKGRPIWRRVKSHYHSSHHSDKAHRWVEFFSQHQTKVTVYWLDYSPFEEHSIDDQLRGNLEFFLQRKYQPLFDN